MAKSNATYWKERFEALEDTQYKKSKQYYQDIEKQFRMATNNVQMDIEKWYARLAENNDISYAAAKRLLKKKELEEFHWTLEEYIKKGQENAVNQRWIKELENASARVHIERLEAMKIQMQQHAELLSAQYLNGTTEFLRNTYADNFYRTAYEIQKGIGIGLNLTRLDTRTIDKIIQQPWASDGANFSDRIWSNKEKLVHNLHTELTQSIIRGENPSKAAERLAKIMGVSKSQASRLVMTESAAISSSSQKDCLNELGVEKYEILATLDSRTSDICQDMDGKVFDMKNYQVGLTAPPFHPNCRSTTVPYFNDEFTEDEVRAARDENGETYYVPADMKYQEWKETYVSKKRPEYLQIKNWEKLDLATLQTINNELELIPKQNQIVLEQADIQIEVVQDVPSHYDPRNHTLYITQMFEPYEVVHEVAHALEDILDIWNDKRFKEILENMKESHVISDIIKDTETFIKPILYIKDDRFVSTYQGRIYEGFEELEVNGRVNMNLLWDYFSEGYRCYIENPKLLYKKDKELYHYIKEKVLHE